MERAEHLLLMESFACLDTSIKIKNAFAAFASTPWQVRDDLWVPHELKDFSSLVQESERMGSSGPSVLSSGTSCPALSFLVKNRLVSQSSRADWLV